MTDKLTKRVVIQATEAQVAAWKQAAGREPLGSWLRYAADAMAERQGPVPDSGDSGPSAPARLASYLRAYPPTKILAASSGPQPGGEMLGNQQNER